MSANLLMRIIWLLSGIGLVLSVLREPLFQVVRLMPQPAWCGGGFRADGVYPGTAASTLLARARHVGSWLDGDEWQGDAETVWLPAPSGLIRVFVAGYPQHPDCSLAVEVRGSDGRVMRLNCDLPNPGDAWKPWDFQVPGGADAWRLVARDRASDACGWLAFSEPIAIPSATLSRWFVLAQVLTTVALTLTLVWGPGLLWTPAGSNPGSRAAMFLGAGPLCLLLTAVFIWLFAGVVRPHYLGFAIVTLLWLAIGARLLRNPPALRKGECRVLAISGLVVIAATMKATYAGGPEGELYAGTISRTLAVGDRSDARISFHVFQVLAQHAAPSSVTAERYFSPWTFFSRGPLAGLIASPIALATSGPPPLAMPDDPWEPFDTTGFAAHRIVLMTLASIVVFALFAVLASVVGEAWAVAGAGLLALSPFGVHEVLFTWPKWEATAWTLLSFLFAHQRRPVAAGLSLGVGYLFHPLAALWAPWLALWAAGRNGMRIVPFISGGVRFAAGLCAVALPWMTAGVLASHTSDAPFAGQAGFIDYFTMADGGPADWSSWSRSRWMNFSNTFLPFWLHYFNGNHPSISSIHAPSGPLVRFAFGWWNTLPLGMGLGVWALSMWALTRAARLFPAAFWMLIAGPALLLVAYWGAHSTGLMRECGHPLFAATIAVACTTASRTHGPLGRIMGHPLFPWLQLPETLLMLWLTTLLNPQPWTGADPVLNAICLGISVLTLGVAAWIVYRSRGMISPPLDSRSD